MERARREHERQDAHERLGDRNPANESEERERGQGDVSDESREDERERCGAEDYEEGRGDEGIDARLVSAPVQKPRPLAVKDVASLEPDDGSVGVDGPGVDERGETKKRRKDEKCSQGGEDALRAAEAPEEVHERLPLCHDAV